MSSAKKAQDLGRHSSGDIGYCYYKKTSRGVIIDWDSATVVSVDCDHDICRYSDVCKFYKRHPVGFVQTYLQAEAQEKTEQF